MSSRPWCGTGAAYVAMIESMLGRKEMAVRDESSLGMNFNLGGRGADEQKGREHGEAGDLHRTQMSPRRAGVTPFFLGLLATQERELDVSCF